MKKWRLLVEQVKAKTPGEGVAASGWRRAWGLIAFLAERGGFWLGKQAIALCF
jgi:hypothetical protein